MKIVILGAAGQLGRQLVRCLRGDVIALSHADTDLREPDRIRDLVKKIRPDAVVNAAAYTQVDRAQSEPAGAFAVNAHGVRDLAAICRDLDCTLLHFSSDYVFGQDASRTMPYRETDAPGPINVYGASKLAGEEFVRAICPRHFIVRTCGLYGPQSNNFVETMLRKAAEGGVIRVVADQTCTPTSALDLAEAAHALLESQAFGLYHVTNAGSCTWHEFAGAIFEIAKKNVPLEAITSAQHVAAARRPRYSVLCNHSWAERGFALLRPWREAIEYFLTMRDR
ncbi:MAG: dTDP-4-dehydrorhamnose reductase [Planctomycetes bacterium]|nr:dTDP-4-dehydrorhamnose reductase [Planctomycetota bacterium]